MRVGCVKEIMNNEFRVGITPDNARAYIAHGHRVYMEKGAGEGSGFPDSEYEKLLGRPIPDGSWTRELTANDAICQLYYAKSLKCRLCSTLRLMPC